MSGTRPHGACMRLALAALCAATGSLLQPATAHAQLHAALEHDGEERADPSDEAAAPPFVAASADAAAHDAHDHRGVQHAQVAGTGTGTATEAAAVPDSGHVAPPPPAHAMGDMSAAQMISVMGMDDTAPVGLLLVDRLERAWGVEPNAAAWNAQAWYGRDFDKLWFKTEGESARGSVERADAQLSWSHAVASYWDTQVGLRRDFGRGADRTWLALGVQGLAPRWFGVEATLYVGEQGRASLRLETDYELLLTQRLSLQPRFELNAYSEADPGQRIGAGVSDAEAGIRLHYELRREVAPYVGIEWHRSVGATASIMRADREDAFETRWVAGVRLWF